MILITKASPTKIIGFCKETLSFRVLKKNPISKNIIEVIPKVWNCIRSNNNPPKKSAGKTLRLVLEIRRKTISKPSKNTAGKKLAWINEKIKLKSKNNLVLMI